MTTPTTEPPGVSVVSRDGSPPAVNGRRDLTHGSWEPAPAGVPATRSTYLDYLPGLYQESEFLGRFLLIFEHILSPIDRTIGNVSHFFDPDLAPAEMLPWLASWLGVVLDVRVPEERRRDLVRAVNQGPTTHVDATGAIEARYDAPFPASVPVSPALLEGPPTLFVRFGDTPLVLLLTGVVGAQLIARRRRRSRTPQNTASVRSRRKDAQPVPEPVAETMGSRAH